MAAVRQALLEVRMHAKRIAFFVVGKRRYVCAYTTLLNGGRQDLPSKSSYACLVKTNTGNVWQVKGVQEADDKLALSEGIVTVVADKEVLIRDLMEAVRRLVSFLPWEF